MVDRVANSILAHHGKTTKWQRVEKQINAARSLLGLTG
jgi:hypothetical protein